MHFLPRDSRKFNVPGRVFASEPYIAYSSHGSYLLRNQLGPSLGLAVAMERQLAMKKAISEMMDRSSFMLGGACRNGVVGTWDILSGSPSELPVEFTTYRKDKPYVMDTSGTAAHPRSMSAICSALLETIEKNALFLFWYGRISRRLHDSFFQGLYFAKVFAQSGLTVRAYVNDYFRPVHVVVALAYSASGVVFMGSGADTDAVTALDHAFQEAYLLGWQQATEHRDRLPNEPWDHEEPSIMDHVQSFESLPSWEGERSTTMEPLWQYTQPLEVLKQSLPDWVSSMHLIFLPQRDLRGIRCVRTFSPELYSHRPVPEHIEVERRINQETLRLTEVDVKQCAVCPMP